MKIYTAGPMAGLSFDQVKENYLLKTKILRNMGYEVLCPMTGKMFLSGSKKFHGNGFDDYPVTTNKAIKARDRWMVGQADIILADFTITAPNVSIGTCMEIAWGDELNKHVIVVMTEDNIHNHCFISECANVIFPEIGSAYQYLNKLIEGI